MTERYVLEALQKGVIAAVAASDDPTLPVKMMGRTITPPSSGKWLEVIHLPNNFDRYWGSEKLYRGALRLVLHYPADDRGVYDPMDLINSIGSYFTKGLKLSDAGNNVSITVTSEPDFMGVMEEASDVLYPVTLRYGFHKTA